MSIRVVDYTPLYESYNKSQFRNPNPLTFQHPCSVLITAAAGGGKSTLLLNILTNPKLKMEYDLVYLCVPSLDEPAYQWLRDYFQAQREQCLKIANKSIKDPKKRLKIDDIPQNFIHVPDPKDIPLPEGSQRSTRTKKPQPHPPDPNNPSPTHVLHNDKLQKLVIIDDFTGDKVANEMVTLLCQKCRKVNTSLIVLNHDMYRLEPTFKKNLMNGYICLYQASTKRLLKSFAQDFAMGVSNDEFEKLFNIATKEKYNFMLIDNKTRDENMKFRKNLDGVGLIRAVREPRPNDDETLKNLVKFDSSEEDE